MSTIIMMGNPGAGKSTLLTSLVEGTTTFHSGVNIGKGKTTDLQEVTYNGKTYIDTPGLADVKIRDQAAAKIERALSKGGDFQVSL